MARLELVVTLCELGLGLADVRRVLDVGRDTVRAAMAVLREAGLVFTVAHRRTFVGPRPE